MHSGKEGRVREGREREMGKYRNSKENHTQTKERERETGWLPAGRNVWYVREKQTADR